MTKVAVLGGSGFVGSAVCNALRNRGHEARPIRAPRLISGHYSHVQEAAEALESKLSGVSSIVNAAGVAEATGKTDELELVNSVLPRVIVQAAKLRGARLVHISSAAVQGNVRSLNETRLTRPFSPYSNSKAKGEAPVLKARDEGVCAIVYRPPGVHHSSREVTRRLARLANSRFSSVAGTGQRPTPQALLENVADAIAFLATSNQLPPAIVNHPSEGLTTAELLTSLGGKEPHHIPPNLARALFFAAKACGWFYPPFAGNVRRVEMLWFGQEQDRSWLDTAGWSPLLSKAHWNEVGRIIREDGYDQ